MEFLFSLVLSIALAHQLDAVRARSWRVLPVLNGMSEESGRAVFIAAHVPLILLLLNWCWGPDAEAAGFWRLVVALFGPINLALHRLFAEHPYYDFAAPLSQGLIFGYAGAGALYLVLALFF